MNRHTQNLIKVSGLKTYFFTFEGTIKAVDDVSFNLRSKETIGIVGESGCGKSITAQSIMRLIPTPPGKIVAGDILFREQDLLNFSDKEMQKIRGKRISMIFQEPMTALNPVFTVGDQIAEMFYVHEKISHKNALDRAVDMLNMVQIPSPHKRISDFPHQLSGGMRQRVMIAMALALKPEVLIADEPTTALDVTIQSQILDLMIQLKEDLGTSVIIITHDLGVVAEIAHRVVVMYAGKIVEEGSSREIFKETAHPYTKGLLKAIPQLGRRSSNERTDLYEIPGVVPSLHDLPKGCSFFPRCTASLKICQRKEPTLTALTHGHQVRCWLFSHSSV